MARNEELPSVRVEIEGVVSSGVDAPEVAFDDGHSPFWAGALTLGVLVAIGAILVLVGSDSGDSSNGAVAEEIEDQETAERVAAELALTGNGPDFHLSIAQSLNDDEDSEGVVAQLLNVSLAAVASPGDWLIGLGDSEEATRLPLLWASGDAENWTQMETVVNDGGEPSEALYSWDSLFLDGPLMVLGASAGGEMAWFVSWPGFPLDRIETEAAPAVLLDRPIATTENSVLFLATDPTEPEVRDCTNTEPAFFVVEFFLDGSKPWIRAEDKFLISQRLDGSFPAGLADDVAGSIGALDVSASFGELTPCAEEIVPVDVRTDGWIAMDGPRWYSIDRTGLTVVDLVLIDGTIEAVESSATISMSDEVPRSLESAEILWADADTLIFATRDASWLIEVPEPPDGDCIPQYAEDGGGVGVARQSC